MPASYPRRVGSLPLFARLNRGPLTFVSLVAVVIAAAFPPLLGLSPAPGLALLALVGVATGAVYRALSRGPGLVGGTSSRRRGSGGGQLLRVGPSAGRGGRGRRDRERGLDAASLLHAPPPCRCSPDPRRASRTGGRSRCHVRFRTRRWGRRRLRRVPEQVAERRRQ